MKRVITFLLSAILIIGNASAQLTIDQQYTTVNNNWGASIWYSSQSPNQFAQSFTAGITGDLVAVELRTLTFSNCDSFKLQIIDGPNPTGTLLLEQVEAIGPNAPDSYYYFTLNTPIPIVATQSYTYQMDTVGLCTSNHPYGLGDSNGSYAGGEFFYSGSAQNGYDLNFNTYVCQPYSDSISTVICEGDTFPIGTQNFTTEGFHSVSFQSVDGCDSTITVYIDVDSADVSVTQNGNTLTANLSGATYQWVNCDSNYAAINGETSISYSPTSNGNYAVIVTDSGCSDTSACFPITSVGIIATVGSRNIQVYPNPFSESFTVKLPTAGIAEISLFNMSGQIVWAQVTARQKVEIANPYLPNGVYLLQVKSSGTTHRLKLVKY